MINQRTKQSIGAALSLVLQHEYPTKPTQLPSSMKHQREILGNILIQSNQNWPEETLKSIDEVLQREMDHEQSQGEWTSLAGIKRDATFLGTDIHVWRGDITKLEVDAIVNAANDQGLGCFQPNHRCIDNVIHRRAGPRLRDACRHEMSQRVYPLVAGSAPLVTSGYHLPSKYVIHATGPQVASRVTSTHKEQLIATYENILDECKSRGIKSVAIPCISTGLFGYPQEAAAAVAIETTKAWVERNPGTLDAVVFDVFTDADEAIYSEEVENKFEEQNDAVNTLAPSSLDKERLGVLLATKYIKEADSVLIVAGAGMSVKEGEMVYVNQDDFKRHYPWMRKYGYKTCYETMGLFNDYSIPASVKWAFWASHMNNMRWKWGPNEGYGMLRNLVKGKDHFVLTSNVDGCFERAGFAADRIYTPQGEWTYLQCMKPCRPDAVFDARPYVEKTLPHVRRDGSLPDKLVPKCPHCGGEMFGNVRGGNNFIHHDRYERGNDALRSWMKDQISSGKKVAVIEIGAGFNTPMVTRFPAEAFARELGANGSLIRINPSDPEVPGNINAVSLTEGWQVLSDFLESPVVDGLSKEVYDTYLKEEGRSEPVQRTQIVARYFGHFDWNRFIGSMKA